MPSSIARIKPPFVTFFAFAQLECAVIAQASREVLP